MTKWSQGGSIKKSLEVGAKAGILAGINDPGSQLNTLIKRTGGLAETITQGLATWAGGGSGEEIKRKVVATGARSLAKYIRGDAKQETSGVKMDSIAAALKNQLGGAATGKYVNSPTLMMVGEEGRGEVVIPTERIRNGMPINKGVANELASIGVPGFENGGSTDGLDFSFDSVPDLNVSLKDLDKQWTGIAPGAGAGDDVASMQARDAEKFNPIAKVKGPSLTAGISARFKEMGGVGGMARSGGADALMGFANVYEQTGSFKQAAAAGVGAGIGTAAGMGLTALGVPPPLSTMIGGAVGKLATRGINKVFKITGGYGEGRKRVMKLMESHIKSGGRFDFGAPSGLNKAMGKAVGGYEKTPTEANFNKMVEKMGTSSLIASMGVPAPALIALAQGKMNGGAAAKVYKTINTSLYGSGADKYRKALAIPALAAGGVVNRPTTALIGERGPEAVVPLGDSEMMKEMKKQNKLMEEMIRTQKETGNPEIRLDGRVVSEIVGQNFYDIGNGV